MKFLVLTVALTATGVGIATAQPLTGLRLWLRADQGVTADGGGLVSSWADQSGSGFSVDQATGAQRPLRVLAAVNGLPAVDFDGVDDFLRSTPVDLLAGQVNYSFFAVVRPDATQKLYADIFDYSHTGGNNFVIQQNFNSTNVFYNNGSVDQGPFSTTSFNLYTATWQNGATATSRLNGTNPMTAAAPNNTFSPPLSMNVGNWQSGNRELNGQIAEILIYNRVLTPSEIGQAETYLSNKYAIATPDNPLPVELSNFTGHASANGIVLSWATATERDNAGFALVRDGVEIARYDRSPALVGHGTTANPSSYAYTDTRVAVGGRYTYQLRSVDRTGEIHDYPQQITVDVTGPVIEPESAPVAFALLPASPNPFNPATTLRFSLSEPSTVTIQVYNGLGQLVATPLQGEAFAAGGGQTARFDGSGLSSGVYHVRLTAIGGSGIRFTASERVLLVR